MLKNNKGYMLAETIIALTLIATVITMVYGITMNYYIKENNDINKFNTTEGLYCAKEVKKFFNDSVDQFKQQVNSNNYIDISNGDSNFLQLLDIDKLYFSKYNMTNEFLNQNDIPYSVKKELKKVNSNIQTQKCEYRYVLIFKDDSYSTIGIGCID